MFTRYEGEVLTPLHIGSGSRIVPMEYCFGPNGCKFIRVDMDSLFRSPEFKEKADSFSVVALQGKPIADTYPFAERYPLYVLDADLHAIGQLRSQDTRGEVLEGIKERGTWYVPGSSIKGAFRTLTYRGNITPEFRSTWQGSIQGAIAGRERRSKFAASRAEQAVSGGSNRSAFRAVKVSDSSFVDSSSVRLTLIKVVEKTHHGTVWKILPHNSTNDISKATPILIEAIAPGTVFTGSFEYNERLLTLNLANLVGSNLLDSWIQKMREAQLAYLQAEERFYRELGQTDVEAECRRISGIVEKLKENEIVLQIGWGTGYTPKTVRAAVDDSVFASVVRNYRMRDGDNHPFPRTRRVVLKGNAPATVLGFVKLKFS